MMTKNLKTEIIAGITTFLTMSYIIVVNPSILATEGTGMSFTGVMAGTILVSIISTFLMGYFAKLPFALAPGMGINAFFTYSLILGQKIPFEEALGMVFWSGIFFVIISATPIRLWILQGIPMHLRSALTAGIGLFLAFLGFKNASIITSHPVTFVEHAAFSKEMLCALLGLLIIFFFTKKKNPAAFIIAIAGSTITALAIGLVKIPENFVAMPDFESVFFKMDLMGGLKLAYLPSIFALILTDLFDSIATFVGVAQGANLIDENGQPKNVKKALLVDSIATLISGPAGTSAATTYIESSAGVEVGGRTGTVAIVTALCFVPFLFFGPLIQMIPGYATAPILIFVGLQMFKGGSKTLSTLEMEDVIPALFIIFMIPFSFSITKGILWGFLLHTVFYLIYKKTRALNFVSIALAILAVLNLIGIV